MVKMSDGVIKVTEENLLFLDANKKTGEVSVKSKVSISDIETVDFSIGKLTATLC